LRIEHNVTEVTECLVNVGISVVKPHLSQQPRKCIVIRQKHLTIQSPHSKQWTITQLHFIVRSVW